jgi:hypothetical protein
MGFRAPNLTQTEHEVRRCIREINDNRNDGWTQMSCKHQLYQLKCLLDDVYPTLPTFAGEEKWEQQRVIDLLKRRETNRR